jgi:hypothetical protein
MYIYTEKCGKITPESTVPIEIALINSCVLSILVSPEKIIT